MVVTALVAAAVALVPPFLGGTRELEISAARALLQVDLPAPAPGRLPLETRLRAALWFGLHLAIGGVVAAAVGIAVPLALIAFAERLGITEGALTGTDVGPLGPGDLWAWTAVGLVLLIGTIYAVAGLGKLAATMAPVLLGPSPAERLAALEARERQLAHRNRLARELHDSVGHALTAVTLQAGAAGAVFDRDPEFARRALTAIEDLGRNALDELDAVLGVLREAPPGASPREGPGREGGPRQEAEMRRAAPTLAEIDRLFAEGVDAEVDVGDLPPHVSREAYRIVQESLTNAAKHGTGTARVRIAAGGDLTIEVTNPLAGGPGARVRAGGAAGSGGRGLDGMRERVRLLGGELTAGPQAGSWRVVARLPITEGRHD
ncbi:histidine kinase [Actinoplanes sp. NPDC049596]|uniref:sensor histidine kinase n=1 Tax=Actinoplanes sp. NPDC049596 TaxID=3154625 RepID=UPI00341FBD79